jgi:hypothetical protein
MTMAGGTPQALDGLATKTGWKLYNCSAWGWALRPGIGSLDEEPTKNQSEMAKSQPISIANHCGRSIFDREKSTPWLSIYSCIAMIKGLAASTTDLSIAGASSVDSGSFAL